MKILSFALLAFVAAFLCKFTQSKSAEDYYKLGLHYDSIGDCKNSIKAYSKAIKIKPQPIYYVKRAEARYGCEKFSNQLDDQILQDYCTTTKLQHGFISAFLSGARYDYLNGKTMAAYLGLNVVLKKDSTNVDAYILRGAIYLEKKDSVNANADFNKALLYGSIIIC